jgi:hypothetical protein
MSYNPPANNAVNFDLKSYTAPSNSSVNFEVSGAGPTGYVLTAEVGAFSLSGQSAVLKAGRKLDAAAAAFTISGQDVLLKHGRKMPVDAGSFILSGQDVDLRKMVAARTLAAEVGVFTLAGQAVGLFRNRTMQADSGDFVLEGRDAGLKKGWLLEIDHAEYLLEGYPVVMYPPSVWVVEKFRALSWAKTRNSGQSSTISWLYGSSSVYTRAGILSISLGLARISRTSGAASGIRSGQAVTSMITRRSDALWQTRSTSTSRSVLRSRSVLTEI